MSSLAVSRPGRRRAFTTVAVIRIAALVSLATAFTPSDARAVARSYSPASTLHQTVGAGSELDPRFPATVTGFAMSRALNGFPIALRERTSRTCVAGASTRSYRPVRVTDGTATFVVDGLAGRPVVSARLTTIRGRSRQVAVAKVRRASAGARTQSRLLRLSLPRSWRSARRAERLGTRLRVCTRPRRAPVSPCGTVLWKADAESSMASEWASNSSVPAAASSPRPDPSRIARSAFRSQGRKSYRFELRDRDDSYGERAELGQAMPAVAGYKHRWFRAGEERWIAMQYYLPTDWPSDDTWQTVFQIKPVSPGGGGPNMGFDAGRNTLLFYGNSNVWGSTEGKVFDGAGSRPGGGYPVTRGRWIKLTWHIVFSARPATGLLEVFGDLADGKGMRTLVPRRRRATMKYLGGAVDPVHLRVGIYRDPAMTATANLYVDGITVATTRAAAETNAYGAG